MENTKIDFKMTLFWCLQQDDVVAALHKEVQKQKKLFDVLNARLEYLKGVEPGKQRDSLKYLILAIDQDDSVLDDLWSTQ